MDPFVHHGTHIGLFVDICLGVSDPLWGGGGVRGVGVGPPWRGETGPTVAPGSLELQKQPSFFLNLSVNIEI